MARELEQHTIHKMEDGKVTTWCGEVFDASEPWEMGDGGVCWKCVQRSNDFREWVILAEVVQAGEEWMEKPDSGAIRARLKAAIEQLDDWMNPGDSYIIIEDP